MTDQPNTPAPLKLPTLSTARIETLADGVFAIVMTLLVFDMRVPTQEQVDAVGLGQALLALTPNIISYVISFIILGVYWVGHHNQFFYIRRSDRTLLWINILYMMFVALVPFSTGLLSRYGSDRISLIVYNLNLICVGVVLYLHWAYATRDGHLLGHALDPKVDRLVRRRILIAPSLYFLAILVSFVSIAIADLMDVLIPVLYVLPANFDSIFRGRQDR
ncbi:MAG: DUF1211 domain-containing protein [Anaerolineae bacterium]|nr:DUF1211 domain-containing protein [Anaerolineae bacterium]